MCCDSCLKMIEERQEDATVKKKCSNDPQGTGIQGSFRCAEYQNKCSKCVRSELWSHEFPCFICAGLPNRPYFKIEDLKGSENN